MLPTDRIAYSAINDRLPLKLPDGARMAVWAIVNVEEWNPRETMPRTVLTPPAGGSPMPDIPNWAWHEYGNRVGFWRLVEVFDELKVPAVLAINGSAIGAYRRSSRAAIERNWEFIGHGFTQTQHAESRERARRHSQDARGHRQRHRQTAARLARPGLTETWETPDLLIEEGFDYVADWVVDDQPVWLKTAHKPILNLPYTQECNDVAMMLIQHHNATEYRDRAIDQFEQIYRDSAEVSTRDGVGRAPLHHGRAAPAEIFPPRARNDQQKERREILDRRTDRGLVSSQLSPKNVTCQRPFNDRVNKFDCVDPTEWNMIEYSRRSLDACTLIGPQDTHRASQYWRHPRGAEDYIANSQSKCLKRPIKD